MRVKNYYKLRILIIAILITATPLIFFKLKNVYEYNVDIITVGNESKECFEKLLPVVPINQHSGNLSSKIKNVNCGPTCLEMYFKYININVTKEDIYKYLISKRDPCDKKLRLFHFYHNKDGYCGVDNFGMISAIKKYYDGKITVKENWTEEMIISSIDLGRPVIMDVWVSWTAKVDPDGNGEHFVLVTGYNDKQFIINNPWNGKIEYVNKGIFMNATLNDKIAPEDLFFLLSFTRYKFMTAPGHTSKVKGPDNLNSWGLALH